MPVCILHGPKSIIPPDIQLPMPYGARLSEFWLTWTRTPPASRIPAGAVARCGDVNQIALTVGRHGCAKIAVTESAWVRNRRDSSDFLDFHQSERE